MRCCNAQNYRGATSEDELSCDHIHLLVPSFHEQRPQRHFEDQEKQNGDALVPAGVIVDLRGSHRSEIATDNADEVIG